MIIAKGITRNRTQRAENLLKVILLDVLASLLGTGLYILYLIYSYEWRGLGTIVASAALFFTVTGLMRANSPAVKTWVRAILMLSVYVIITGFALGPTRLQLAGEAGGALVGLIGGIFARHSWEAGSRSRAYGILGGTFAIAQIACFFGAPVLAQLAATRKSDFLAPEFSATGVDGTVLHSSQFKGQITVLYFWASWCPLCRQEFPKLEMVYDRYKSNPGVAFLAIDESARGETLDDARNFVAHNAPQFPVALDDRYAAAAFRLRVTPTLLILDRSWHVRLIHVGYDSSERYVENLSKEIETLLNEPPAKSARPFGYLRFGLVPQVTQCLPPGGGCRVPADSSRVAALN